MDFSVSVLSRRGGRLKNEDRANHSQTETCALCVLADGMGGHPDGEVAAEIAVRTAIEMFHKEARTTLLLSPENFLVNALRTAHHRIIRYGTEQGLIDVPRTTAIACIVQDNKIWWANCGDSRLYMVRDKKIFQHTVDHSYAKSGKSMQGLDPKLLASPSARNTLYTCLGSMALPVVDVTGPISLAQGDRILLCSDGLWSVLNETKIAAVMGSDANIHNIISLLVESALTRAGKRSDNVTAIGLEWMPKATAEALPAKNANTADTYLPEIFSDNADLDTEINTSISEINALLEQINQQDEDSDIK